MRLSKLKMLGIGMLGAAIFSGLGVGAGVAFAYQGHMWDAHGSLQNAREQLQEAEADKAGHRENAIGLVDQAINEINLGIQAGR